MMRIMNTKPSFLAIHVALALIYCSFCIHLLFLQVFCGHDGTEESSHSCSSFMHCANLGNISYPFWGSASCAASPSYVLSNCSSSSQAYWDAFSSSAAAPGVTGAPAVVSLFRNSEQDYPKEGPSVIQLSWNKSLLDLHSCAQLFPAKKLSQYNIPSSINLTAIISDKSNLAHSTIRFSPDNTYLLFNCANNASSNIVAQFGSENFRSETESGCEAFKESCGGLQAKTPCIQWSVPASTKELMLQHVLDSLSCSHFTFGVGEYGHEWFTGLIELIWEGNCNICVNAGGRCIFNNATIPPEFIECECTSIDFNRTRCERDVQQLPPPSPDVCYHGFKHCHPTLFKIITGVVVSLVAGKVLVAVKFRREIRKGLLVFSMKLASIAIAVLTKSLKHLQAFSYRPSHSFKNMDLEGLTERPVEYSYSTIASATNSFSIVVGEGGFGMVYKGTLPQASTKSDSGRQIAVKVLETRTRHSKKQFLNEVVTIGRIHHLNVVRLLGFCMQEDHEMLVYEYVANGSLDKWLFHNNGKDEERVLAWEQRYAIAVGIAKGLSYLHEECRHRTVHCDIKPQNILLDEEMCPKIADFGLARLMSREESEVVTLAKGTPGYMAPEFWMGGESRLSTKFDVYSYGMVLLELMSGCRNFMASGHCFPAVAFEAAMHGDFETILDARLGVTMNTSDGDEAQKIRRNQIRTAAFVALWCIQDQPASRPCMSEVVQYLDGVADVPEDPPQPTISTSNTSILPHKFSNTCNHRHDSTPISVGR